MMLTVSVIFGRLSFFSLIGALIVIGTAILSPHRIVSDDTAAIAAGIVIVAWNVNSVCRAMHSRYWDDELWR